MDGPGSRLIAIIYSSSQASIRGANDSSKSVADATGTFLTLDPSRSGSPEAARCGSQYTCQGGMARPNCAGHGGRLGNKRNYAADRKVKAVRVALAGAI